MMGLYNILAQPLVYTSTNPKYAEQCLGQMA